MADNPAFGLIGERLGHSFSPSIYKRLCELDYGLFPLAPEELAPFLNARNFSGLSVTIPYKKAVIAHCNALSPVAERIGSVNVILPQPDGTLLGDNTDYHGVLYLFQSQGADIADKKALILGNGGVSPTVRVALEDLGAREIITISRSGEDNYQNLHRHSDAQIIVNTTPVGMYPNTGVSPIDLTLFPHCTGVYDLIYNPARTQLMLDAQRLGIPCGGGLGMLVAQAKVAAELFCHIKLPDACIGEILGEMERDTKNILLVGMPSSGKSTVGLLLATKLNRTFVDTDRLIEEKCGCSIPSFFAREGEAKFRELEHEILCEISKQSGLVIATGGGIVTRPENHDPLRQNSTVVFLHRKLDSLSTHNRPLSQTVSVEILYTQRLPLYQAVCDMECNNDTAVEHTVTALIRSLHL